MVLQSGSATAVSGLWSKRTYDMLAVSSFMSWHWLISQAKHTMMILYFSYA